MFTKATIPISLAGQCMYAGAKSSLLNPKNAEVGVVGNIIGKPLRAVARTIYTIVVGVLIAPCGTIYHFLAAIYNGVAVLFVQAKDKDVYKAFAWERLKAAGTDGGAFLGVFTFFTQPTFILTPNNVSYWFSATKIGGKRHDHIIDEELVEQKDDQFRHLPKQIPTSFTGHMMLKGAISNLLNPPNNTVGIFGTLVGKPLRAVMRAIYTIVVGVLIAPLGTIYHLLASAKRGVVALVSSSLDRRMAKDFAWEHLKAAGMDASAFLGTFFVFSHTNFVFSPNSVSYWFSTSKVITKTQGYHPQMNHFIDDRLEERESSASYASL